MKKGDHISSTFHNVGSSGESLFLRKLVLGIPAQASSKNLTRPLMPSAPRFVLVFARLPETHWTMLVQDVDKHLPELQGILDVFNFIPDWRRDDLMISYATEFGSVGPHTDAYDVFLLQAMGTRRWQIGDQPLHEAKLIDGLELQILSEFTSDQSWDLLPGDMLYLPPHFAHHGVAVNDCMTYSIGFRAPAAVEMLDALVNALLEQGLGKSRYQDPDLVLNQHSAEIDIQAVARLKHLLHLAKTRTGFATPGHLLILLREAAGHRSASVASPAASHGERTRGLVVPRREQGLGKSRYQDPDLVLNQHSAEIDIQAVARLKHLLHLAIDQAEPQLATALGRFVIETKPGLATIAAEASIDLPDIDELTNRFDAGGELQRNAYYRFAWTSNTTGGQLFMAGESYIVGLEGVRNLTLLCEKNSLSM
jgi:ribosomal protein L16 Arg81 hydroxylase